MKVPTMPTRKAVSDPPKKTTVDKDGKRKAKKPKTYEKQYAAWVVREQAKDLEYANAHKNYLEQMETYNKVVGKLPSMQELQSYQPVTDLSSAKTKAEVDRILKGKN